LEEANQLENRIDLKTLQKYTGTQSSSM